jgi:ribonuclease R
MTYDEVRRLIEEPRPGDEAEVGREVLALLGECEALMRVLLAARAARGSIDFDLPEGDVILDTDGVTVGIMPGERHVAHRLVEEFMIAANEAVARHLTEKQIPLLYRVHEGPEKESLEAVAPFLLSLGYRLPLKKDKIAPLEIQKLLEAARGKPEERVLNRVLLRSMKQALYQPENLGHFGLASICYTHFTSPIRRYPDLIVHRMLDRALRGGKLTGSEREDLSSYLSEAGKHTSNRERNAMDAEREMLALKKTQFMMDKIGEEFRGFITSLANFGFFVELDTYFVEGLVKIASLTDDDYYYYEKEYLIKGLRHGRKFRLGDNVRVKVARINAFRSEIDFELVHS